MTTNAMATKEDGDSGGWTVDRHDVELRDVRDARLVVSYNRVRHNPTSVESRHVSARLPFDAVTVFGRSGTVDVADLTAEQRAWIEAESERIEFEEVA